MQSKRLQTPPGGAPRRISEKRLKHSRPPFHVQAKPAYRPRIFRCFFFFTVCFRVASAFSRLWDASFLFASFSGLFPCDFREVGLGLGTRGYLSCASECGGKNCHSGRADADLGKKNETQAGKVNSAQRIKSHDAWKVLSFTCRH